MNKKITAIVLSAMLILSMFTYITASAETALPENITTDYVAGAVSGNIQTAVFVEATVRVFLEVIVRVIRSKKHGMGKHLFHAFVFPVLCFVIPGKDCRRDGLFCCICALDFGRALRDRMSLSPTFPDNKKSTSNAMASQGQFLRIKNFK